MFQRFTLARLGQSGLLGFPLPQQFGNHLAPVALAFRAAFLDKIAQHFPERFHAPAFERLIEFTRQALLKRNFLGQGGNQRFQFTFRKCPFSFADTGNLVINLPVIIR